MIVAYIPGREAVPCRPDEHRERDGPRVFCLPSVHLAEGEPQRLVSLTYEEEERRALRSWNRFAFAKNFKPEWCNIQLWMTILEQVFPDMIGYNVEHLEVLMKWSDSGLIGLS